MTSLTELDVAVRHTLATGRIGTPVFVRYHAAVAERGCLLEELACMTSMARDWLGQEIASIHALGSVAEESISLTVELRTGGTAFVSAATAAGPPFDLDLVILGNRGALYHQGQISAAPPLPYRKPEARLAARIRKALGAAK